MHLHLNTALIIRTSGRRLGNIKQGNGLLHIWEHQIKNMGCFLSCLTDKRRLYALTVALPALRRTPRVGDGGLTVDDGRKTKDSSDNNLQKVR